MGTPKTLAWTGAAAIVIAAAFLFDVAPQRDDVASARVAEPELFAFLKPMETIRALPAAPAPSEPAGAPIAYASPEDALAMQASAVETQVKQMRAQGASDDEVYRFRAARLSAQSAEYLARMEREDAAWRQRVDVYLQERNRMLARNDAGAGRSQALQQLRDARFTREEQERLDAYEPAAIPQLRLP